MNWQFTPVMALYFIMAANGLVLAYNTWKLRPARGASQWAAAMLFAAIWSAGEGIVVINTDRQVRLAFIRVLYLGITSFIFFWSLFIITFSNYERWLNKYTIALLAIVPLTTFILVLFVEGHPLFYESYELALVNGFISSQKVYGPAFWLWAGYSYLILFVGSVLLLQAMLRFPNLFRGQAVMLLIGLWIPTFFNVAYISGINPIEPFDPTPLAFAVSGIFITLALRRYRFLNVVPVAHSRVFKTVKSGVVVIDREGRVIEMNPAAEAILRQAKDDVVGETVFKAFAEHRELLEQFQDVMETRTEISMNKRDYELRITPLHGRAGRVAGRIIMLYDITRQQQLIKDLDAYAHTVAHELKSPLTLIAGYASFIEDSEELPEGVADSASIISQTGLRMVSIIDELLLMASLQRDQQPKTIPLDMGMIAGGALDRLTYQTNESEATITQPDEWPTAMGYAPWVEEIWANYISNALKYGGEPPEIELGAEKQDGMMRYWVKDNGKGLTKAERESLFAEFARLDTHADEEGHGLGLSIVERIAHKLGGEVGVESEVGKGSTFYFTLPTA